MRRAVVAVCLAGAAVLQGCAGGQVERASLRGLSPATEAIVMPPPGGPAVIGVTQRGYSNAIEQEIGLSTDSRVAGQNLIRVQMFGPRDTRNQTALPDRPLGATNIAAEMRQLFPGVRMQRSAFYVQNSYGPFGYAVGRQGAADTCLYGWQRISHPMGSNPFAARGTVQIRVRVCQSGASEQALLAIMYGYVVTAGSSSNQWNPYGDAPPPDPRIGALGEAIYPQEGGRVATVFPPAPVAEAPPVPRSRPRPVAPRVEDQVPQRTVVPAGAPIVPPPPGSGRTIVVPPPPVVPEPR